MNDKVDEFLIIFEIDSFMVISNNSFGEMQSQLRPTNSISFNEVF